METLLLSSAFPFFFFFFFFFFFLVSAAPPSNEFIFPNFTATNRRFIDNSGAFLFSKNATFKAAIFNPGGQQSRFYLCVIHSASGTVVWSANRDLPISNSGTMTLTRDGITVSDHDGVSKWSTPSTISKVSLLQLTESGNLRLLDRSNVSIWETFDNPTDTVVAGQVLRSRTLSSSVSGDDFSTGDYRLGFSDSDAVLTWRRKTYWKLSMDPKAYTNSNYAVDAMTVNGTGVFLMGRNGSVLVSRVALPPAEFRIVKLSPSGQLVVSSFSDGMKEELDGPSNVCQIPFICGEMGWCSVSSGDNPTCQCPSGFRPAGSAKGSSSNSNSFAGCVPSDGSSLVRSCQNSTRGSNSSSYVSVGGGMDYFALDFSQPTNFAVNLSVCQDFCTEDCSCLGIFYDNSSGSCYAVEDDLGSLMSNRASGNDQVGFIKVLQSAKNSTKGNEELVNKGKHPIPLTAIILLSCIAFIIIFPTAFLIWRRRMISKQLKRKLSHADDSYSSEEELDAFYIPGLPLRFDYEELEEATENFKVQIGSGGFGSVYKGILPDKSDVAVKKITNVGIQGKRDFCTEIAIIGNVHHVNLVKLRGFCAQGRQRLLVYEYMNRGSLDRTLFGNSGPVLEWRERYDIALGTARGLAYLHTGCEHKIIHCDVKPENILLHEQFQAKISDFGLSKLLGPEQSSLFTTMRGTRGYLAPEWLTNSAISEKTDVYSYGMVLLELVSGRKNCSMVKSASHSMDDSSGGGGGRGGEHQSSTSSQFAMMVYFPLFALEMHEQGKYMELADPRLEGRVGREEVEKLVRIALCCVHEEPCLRPSMVTVVGMLEGGIPLGQPRMESLNFLRFYGRRFAESSMIEEGEDAIEQREALLNTRHDQYTSTGSNISDMGCVPLSFISSQQISGPR
ncbi:G-type lectin S-receptor-like serine/threonine-protein kinase At5g35370 [Linum grandiflorum]